MTDAAEIVKIVELASALVVVFLIVYLGYMYWLTKSQLKLKEITDDEKSIDENINGMSLSDVVNLNNNDSSNGDKKP